MKIMNITSCLFRKIILLRVETGQSGIVRKELAIVRFLKGKATIGAWENFKSESFSKWKNSPALLVITGEDIISKVYDKQDANNKRIQKDTSFLWNIETNDSREEIISFMRKDNINDFLQVVKQHHLILIDTWLYAYNTEYSLQMRLEKLYADQFKSSTLFKTSNYRDTLANALLKKIFLPVLLFFFALLLGNYFLNSYYTKQYQQKQNIIQQNKRKSRMNSAEEQKKNQLLAGFNQIPDRSFALLSDRIASYIPANMYLASIDVFPAGKKTNLRDKKGLSLDFHTIRLKGVVETPGSVTLLSQLLEADNLFEKVKVIQLDRIKNKNLFEFELEITL